VGQRSVPAGERAGWFYGRGADDDEAGMLAHVAALGVLGDDLPVGVFVEGAVAGAGEYSSGSLNRLLADNTDWLHSDVIIIDPEAERIVTFYR
jgi:acetylornithine deacetylase/succinyl-diaminopimelate desuccinylase-like protein